MSYAPAAVPIRTIGSSTTLTISDLGGKVQVNSSGAATVTVPTHANVPFPVGAEIEISAEGVGLVTVTGDTGVTVSSFNAVATLAGQFASASIVQVATDSWELSGALGGGASVSSGALPSTGTTGAPTSGTWATGQLAIDSNHELWKCTVGGTPGTWSRIVTGITPQDFGAKGDAVYVIDGAMTPGSATLACTTSLPFTSTAVDGGKLICVSGAGTSGATLVTIISSVTDTGHAVLGAAAGTSVTGATTLFGTDDTAPIRSWLSQLTSSGIFGLVTARHMTNIVTIPFNATARQSLLIRGEGGGIAAVNTSPGAFGQYGSNRPVSVPNVAIVNTASGNYSFFSFTNSHNVLIDGVAFFNANSAHNGTLLDWSGSSASPLAWRPKIQNCYIGGIDNKVITAGQQGVNTEHCAKPVISDCVFAFTNIGWVICNTNSVAAEARGCQFLALGDAGAKNPGEAAQFTSCEFGVRFGDGTAANQHGVALATTPGFAGWDQCLLLNCHFSDMTGFTGDISGSWIYINQATQNVSPPYKSGVAVIGGYWGGTPLGYTLVYLQSNVDTVYLNQLGLPHGVAGTPTLVRHDGAFVATHQTVLP